MYYIQNIQPHRLYSEVASEKASGTLVAMVCETNTLLDSCTPMYYTCTSPIAQS